MDFLLTFFTGFRNRVGEFFFATFAPLRFRFSSGVTRMPR